MQSSSKTSKPTSQDPPASLGDSAQPEDVNDTLLQAGVFAGLVGFGVLYDRLVSSLERTYGQHGYTSFLVVLGVSVTVAAITPFIGPSNALRLCAAFAAAGVPMIVGDSKRYLQYRHDVSAALARARSTRNEAAYARQTPGRKGQGSSLHPPCD